MKRRDLLKSTVVAPLGLAAAAAAAAAGQTPRAPASDRIRVGMIGVGNFGMTNLADFMKNPDVEIAGICEVFQPNLDRALKEAGGKAKVYRDYRRLLDDKEIDAVVITTPEHWHAIMGIDACDAGKDVYVEKPIAHHIRDGRLLVDAARRNNRVVQVGTQQRSGAHFQRAVKYIQEGRIGDICYASCWNHSPRNLNPPATTTGGPPPGMDWDMWLGPAPKLPYDEVWNTGRRGSWEFWGGMITEWGSHLTDIILWAMNAKQPDAVVAAGGRFVRTWGEIPDTLQVTYNFPKFLFHYSVLNHNTYGLNGDAGAARFGSFGMQFQGTKGTLFVDRSGFRVTPQPMRMEEPNQPPPPPTTDSRAPGFYYTSEILPETSDSSVQHWPHVRNFLDCVKSRKRPNADIEDGHNVNVVNRLGNIAYRVGRRLRWDSTKEQVIDDAEANRLVIGTYREPWTPKGTVMTFVSVTLALSLTLNAATTKSLSFTKRHLFVNPYESCAVADLNKDGYLDIVYGAYVLWGPSYVPQTFRPNHVAKEYMRANSDHVYDVDKDGWLDIIAGGWTEDGIYWYRNPGTSAADKGTPWEMHKPWEARLLAKTRGTMEMFALHDYDGDGTPELHSANYRKQHPLEVWRFTKGPDGSPALTPFVLGAEGGGHGFAWGDVNGDGREDVLTEIGWYERPAGDPFARAWTLHPETALPHPSCPFVVKDLNKDGRLDIIFGRGHDVGLYWWEQQAPKADGTTVWKKHVIDESWSQAHAIALADLDGDGEEELIAGKCIWAHDGGDPGAADPPGIYYYVWHKSSAAFTRHTISPTTDRIALGRQYSVIDLNGDGRLDLTAPSKQGLWIFLNDGFK